MEYIAKTIKGEFEIWGLEVTLGKTERLRIQMIADRRIQVAGQLKACDPVHRPGRQLFSGHCNKDSTSIKL